MSVAGATTAVPAWISGAWIRSLRSIDDSPPLECSDVVWLQVGPWFADVRLPRPGRTATHPYDVAHAFSGRLEVTSTTGAGARVVWHHDLDTAGHHPADAGASDDAGPDTADVEVRDGVLIEFGAGYVEWWGRPEHRPTASDGSPVPGLVLEHGAGGDDPAHARMVWVDGMAVAVWAGPSPGGAWCSAAGGWEPSRVVGVVPGDLGIGATLRAIVEGAPPPGGWHHVEER